MCRPPNRGKEGGSEEGREGVMGAVSPSRCEPQGVLTHTNRERKALLKLIKALCLTQL